MSAMNETAERTRGTSHSGLAWLAVFHGRCLKSAIATDHQGCCKYVATEESHLLKARVQLVIHSAVLSTRFHSDSSRIRIQFGRNTVFNKLFSFESKKKEPQNSVTSKSC